MPMFSPASAQQVAKDGPLFCSGDARLGWVEVGVDAWVDAWVVDGLRQQLSQRR